MGTDDEPEKGGEHGKEIDLHIEAGGNRLSDRDPSEKDETERCPEAVNPRILHPRPHHIRLDRWDLQAARNPAFRLLTYALTTRSVSSSGLQPLARKIFEGLYESYDRVLEAATLMQDRYWKRWIVSKAPLRDGMAILDVGCGT